MKTNKKQILIAFGILLLGILMGRLFFSKSMSQKENITQEHEHDIDLFEPQSSIWTCAMHPHIQKNEAGNCPICGMELIPVEQAKKLSEKFSDAIQMSPTAMKLADVQTQVVGKETATSQLSLTGKVQVDENSLLKIPAHFHGRIDVMHVKYEGQYVEKGQLIAEVYSPELMTAQEELRIAAKDRNNQPEIYAAIKQKLKNWKIKAEVIKQMEQSELPLDLIPIHAHHSGHVYRISALQGDHLDMGDALFELANYSRVWVWFDLYQSDLSKVKMGDEIHFSTPAYPGEQFSGKVNFIDYAIDPQTQIAKARVEVENPDLKLKPELFVSGQLGEQDQMAELSIAVPRSAVLWTGKRSVVFVKQESAQGIYFRLREVELGKDLDGQLEVVSGSQVGEEIAVNGTFSIDAAAQLAGKSSMMSKANQHEQLNNEEFEFYLNHYMDIKNALASDEFNLAQQHLHRFMNFFEEGKGDLAPEAVEIRGLLQRMHLSENIEDFRKHFMDLSNRMIVLLEAEKTLNQKVFLQFCPMANNNQGASWLSLSEQIKNPYFGSSMLDCGNVLESY